MSTRNPTSWTWAQACALLEEAECMHRQFFRLGTSTHTQAVWEPPVDILEDETEVIIIVALPGVASERVEIVCDAGILLVRAECRIPFLNSRRSLRRLEIPYGVFERRIVLPAARFDSPVRECVDGCLILRLRKLERL